MTTSPVSLTIAQEDLAQRLQIDAMEMVKTAEGDLVLDFSEVLRIDTSAAQALEELANLADQRGAKLLLRNVNVSIYKTLTLLKLVRRFTFLS